MEAPSQLEIFRVSNTRPALLSVQWSQMRFAFFQVQLRKVTSPFGEGAVKWGDLSPNASRRRWPEQLTQAGASPAQPQHKHFSCETSAQANAESRTVAALRNVSKTCFSLSSNITFFFFLASSFPCESLVHIT